MSEQRCRICGCTALRACVTANGPCYWVEPDLCSAPGCAGEIYKTGGMRLQPDTAAAFVHPVILDMTVGQMMTIIGGLQLTLRHPNFNRGPAAGEAERFLRQWVADVKELISVTPQIRYILDAGDDPALDVEKFTESPVIITPP